MKTTPKLKPARWQDRRWLFPVLPWLMLCGGLVLSGLFGTQMRQHETEAAHTEFALRADEIVANLSHRMASHAQILRGVAGLFAASTNVSRDDFRHYVENLHLTEHYPGIQGIGFNQAVAAKDKARHIAAVRGKSFPSYDIWPAGERELYAPVVYIEPFDWRNHRAFGFDVYSEPLRAQALARARDEGQAAMTGKVRLAQETDQDVQAGTLLFAPIYRPGAPLDSVEQRREALLGWASLALRMGDLLGAYLKNQTTDLPRRVAIRIYSGETADPANLIYDSHPDAALADGGYEALRQSSILGTTWTLQIAPLPGYWGHGPVDPTSRTVIAAGIALSLAFAFAAWVFSSNHLRVAAALRQTHRANRNLAEQEAMLRAVYDNSSVGIYLVNTDCVIIHANQYMAKMFMCPLEELVGKSYYSLVPPIERKLARQRFDRLLAGDEPTIDLERLYRRLDKSEFWGQVTARPFRDAENLIVGIVGVIADITVRRQMEEALRISEARHRLLADNASDLIWTMDIAGRITFVSPAVKKLRGFAAEQAMAQPLEEWFAPESRPPALSAIGRALEAVRTGKPLEPLCVELEQTRADGASIWTETTLSGFYDAKGRAGGILGVTRDITERKQTQDRIAHLAHYDPLTNLCNRALFFDRVEQAIVQAGRERTKLALMYIDLDKFKPINDNYGHPVGDRLLEQVAERMRACVRASDTVGRIGGDEFVVLLPHLGNRADALGVAEKIRHAIRKPFDVAGHTLNISTSIGIAVYPEHGAIEHDLSKNADIAMYHVKENGGDNIQMYGEGMPTRLLQTPPRDKTKRN